MALPQVRCYLRPGERSTMPLQHLFGDQWEVEGVALSVDGPVQIFPVTFNFDMVVHSPSATRCAPMPVKGPIQQWYQAGNPMMQRGMVNDNTASCHYHFKVA